ncbi:MAG: class I SAM-dependent methyltransferase, partial [Hyphomicrobiaceae bacterium]
MTCRHCSAALNQVFVDLGHQPPSNAYLAAEALEAAEVYAPLKTYVCSKCWLVQIPAHHRADELFTSDYAYFSSVSSTWLDHARRYVAEMTARFGLGGQSFVVEVASNDGYLLQYVRDAGVPCLGIEPTASTAA